ncbi:sensor histidine kinase [Streptomyces rishiriensis]|uniref:Anti-sigma regulatory factor (Ser/Thr protein kinase) n=1 Tax=Streptomyces rishiriensis TaxID=68264 RepID=A0ABU0P273_STRRH|nr:sensor histidine kinase [Streptomyces rishiriensis]MDQ0585496.1 anti-sigma regulatory factor (Ser/Thr protein kinase) [Streptomyces rishiriensis]
MSAVTTNSRMQPGDVPILTHQALIYGTDEDFLAATVPFCLDGLAQDDAVLAVTTPRNIDLLRQQLGDAAGHVEFVRSDQWYDAPGRTLAAYHRYVGQRTGDTGRHRQVRVIGEPVWHGRDALETAEWTRYEAVINVAFADCPAWIVCPYDTRTLPSPLVADARRTHPEMVTGPAAEPSPHYADPKQDGFWERELAPASRDTQEHGMRFDADLTPVRAFVAASATSLGMSQSAADRLVFAANEVATNAVQHGGGSGHLALWRSAGRIVCDITDARPGATDWFLGYLPPDPGQRHGHGLWAVRQLCDLMEVRPQHSGMGTTVRLHLNLT